MNFTLWTVGLVAFAALAYLVKRKFQKRTDRRAHEKSATKHRQSAAELDRKACLELAKGLNASAPSEEGVEKKAERPAAKVAAESATPRATRSRQSSEAAHGFDPDLPPSRTS